LPGNRQNAWRQFSGVELLPGNSKPETRNTKPAMWSEIKTADVLNEFTPAEKAMLENIQAGTGNLAGILAKVIGKVRGSIKAGGNQLDFTTNQTIPDQLADETIAIARWRWLSSFPSLKAFKTDERKKANDEALALLERISSQAADRPRVELPAITDTTPSPLIAPSFGTRPTRAFPNPPDLNFTSGNQDG
jgi:hypothetical protein